MLISFSFNIPLSAATLPSGFTETQLAVGLSNPTAMAFAPDGRLFVCQQGGQVRVIKNGSLLAAPFLSVTVNSQGERGLLGIAFDPDFNNNHFIYVYYTATTPAVHNRVSRFTADGDLAAPGSEAIIFELNNLNSAIHNGGAMHFGPDGKLYIAVGENSVPSNAQTLENLLGKLLRINSNGTIPTDNPFFNTAAGNNRAIWALGLRNPYTFAFQPGTGRLFINDVGQDGWEEINEGIAGANYGWPTCEGACSNPDFKNPVFAYSHLTGETLGCAITGGAFYNPVTAQFPDSYAGSYFFADFCSGWIKRIDPANPGHSTDFASDILYPVGLLIGPEGGLYYLERGHGAVYRILYAPVAPLITTQPQSQIAGEGQTVTFSVTASGSQPLAYQWQRDGVNIQGATSSSYTISSVTSADQGAQFRVIISNIIGSVTSNTATLTVSQNKPPAPVILTPAEGTLYSAGDIINFSGTATDTEDGSLPASAFTWRVDFHHETHSHPFMASTSGVKSGSFNIPTLGETSSNVWYRLTLTVTDSGGFSTTVLRDILPRKSTIRLATNPQWLLLTLDGQPVTAPAAVVGVVGMTRTLGALSPQTLNGVTYEFDSWSDGGAAIHDISTQSSDTTYTANFHVKPPTTGPAFQFDASSYQAGEDDGSITINVSRSGDASAAASVNYATSNGTASERGDYITALGTIDFAPGEISRSFSILLTDDLYVENSETVNLALSNPTGGVSLGNQSTALLIIHDNETAEPTTNPADQPEFFVRQHYLDFLNREPDPGGLAYWTSQIASCGNNAFCLLQRKIGVSAAFFVETEFQQTGFFIHRMYRAGLGQRPSYLEFMADRSRLNEGPNLNAEKEAYAAEFVRRSPFVNKYLQNTTPESFVDALLLTVKNTSGVDLSGKRGELLGEYNAGGDQSQSRARVLRKLIEYAEYIEVEYNRAFVLAQYFGYLRRDPDEGGYLFWLNVLNNKEPGNYRGMVCSFITSGEYQDRFSPVRTHSNRECQ